MAKVKGEVTLTATSTQISVKGLDPNTRATLKISYVDEDGDPSFGIGGYANTDASGSFTTTIGFGTTYVQSITGKDIDHAEVEASTDLNSTITLASKSD